MTEIIPKDYAVLLNDIKQRIRSAQYEALKAVNKELISLYWDIGRMIIERQKEESWGKSVVERIAQDLRAEFPGIKGFSARNIWYMRKFYSNYVKNEKLQPLVAEIGWAHNLIIMDRCTDELEREFYIRMTRKFGWSKNVLIHQIENQSYEKTLLNQTNFEHTLPIEIRNQANIVSGAEIKTKKQQVCCTGEFLVAEIDAKIGGFGIVPPELDCAIVSSHYFLFVIDETRLDRRFLDFFIRTPYFREQVSAQGSTNYAAIRPADVLSYKVPLPPLQEQRRVVARIEELAAKIEEARKLQREAVEETRALTVSISRTVFNPANLDSWLNLSIEECCKEIIDYRGRTPPLATEGIPHLTSANIKNGNIDWNTTRFVSEETYNTYMTRGIPKPGDVIFTMEAPLGEAAVVPDERQFSLAQRTLLLRSKNEIIDGKFLAKVITSPEVRETIYSKATGTTVKGIASKRLKHIELNIPPLPEQRRIVAYLDTL